MIKIKNIIWLDNWDIVLYEKIQNFMLFNNISATFQVLIIENKDMYWSSGYALTNLLQNYHLFVFGSSR